MRSRGPPEQPGARIAGGSEAWPEALRASARTGGTEDTEFHRGVVAPPWVRPHANLWLAPWYLPYEAAAACRFA